MNFLKKIKLEDDYGWTSPHFACEFGYTWLVDILIKLGINFDQIDKNGIAPIHLAAKNGHLEIIKNLDCNIFIKDKKGRNVLYYAAKYGHADLVDFLMKNDPQLYTLNTKKPILFKAIIKGHLNVVKLLKNIDPNWESLLKSGEPTELACRMGNLEMIVFFEECFDTFSIPDFENFVCENGNLEIIKYLETIGGDFSDSFFYACKGGNIDIVSYLCDKVYDSSKNRKYLEIAIQENHFEVVKKLISIGQDPLSPYDENSPLAKAIKLGKISIDMVKLVFKKKCITPDILIYSAIVSGNLEILKYIIETTGFAELNYRVTFIHHNTNESIDLKEASALQLSTLCYNLELFKYIFEISKNYKDILTVAVLNGRLSVVSFLMEKNFDPNEIGFGGQTALTIASKYGFGTFIDILLKNGGNPNFCANNGQNSWEIANTENMYDIYRIFFKHGWVCRSKSYTVNNNFTKAIKPEIFYLLLCAREKNEKSPFYKKNFPIDLIKIIVKNIEY